MAAKNKFDMTNLNNMATDPLMDRTVNDLISVPENKDTNNTEKEGTDKNQKEPINRFNGEASDAEDTHKKLYNYRKEKREIAGVGVISKTVSESGKVIGRPSKPIKVKKKPITLTLTPELYDVVKERAAADHRTTSEYLAIIVESYFNGQFK